MRHDVFRSASPLAEWFIRNDKDAELVIITGLSGAGKSTMCSRFAAQVREMRLSVGGLISLPVFVGGRKVAIELVNQITGERRDLAIRRGRANQGIGTANWLFDPDALSWGNQQLLDLPPCDIVLLDELGPLEFTRGEGLQAGLELIDNRSVPRIVAVVRPGLLPQARERWPWSAVLVVDPTQASTGRIC